jgi:hypothetical protein
LVGQRFERLLVVSYSHKDEKQKIHYWNCVCDCGNKTSPIRSTNLKNGHTK